MRSLIALSVFHCLSRRAPSDRAPIPLVVSIPHRQRLKCLLRTASRRAVQAVRRGRRSHPMSMSGLGKRRSAFRRTRTNHGRGQSTGGIQERPTERASERARAVCRAHDRDRHRRTESTRKRARKMQLAHRLPRASIVIQINS